MSSGGTNLPKCPPNDKGKDVVSTTRRIRRRPRKVVCQLAPQSVLDQLAPWPATADKQTGKDVASTTTNCTREEIRVVSQSYLDKFVPMPATAHTQTPSTHTYAQPPPTHTLSQSTHTSPVVYPQHAYTLPTSTPSTYAQPFYPSPIFPLNAYAPPVYAPSTYTLPTYAPLTNPLSGEPSHKRPPSGKGKGVASTATSRSRKVTRVVSNSPLDQFIPMPTTAHTQIPSSHTYTQPPPTQFPLPVYPQQPYAPPAYIPSTYPPPTYPLSGEPSHKLPPNGKRKDVASTTTGRSHKVTRVVSRSLLDQFIPMSTTAHTQTSSPHTDAPPPPAHSQPPSTQFPLPVHPQHAYAPPAYTPSTYRPPTYPQSSAPSHKVPQFTSMPNPGFQGTQGTSLKSSHPKPSQPQPYQADEDGIHDVEHLIEPDVEPNAQEVELFDDGRHIIQPSTKGFLPSKPAKKSIPEVIQSQYKKPWPKYRDLNDDDRSIFIKAISEKSVRHARHNDRIESNFHLTTSHSLSDRLREVRLKGQCPHWLGETTWQRLLEHWSSASFRLMSAKEKKKMASKKGGCLQKKSSISTTQHAARITKKDTHTMKETGDYVDEPSKKNQEKCEARKSQTRSQNNSTSPSMSCNPAKDVVAPLSTCSGVVGGKKKSCLYDDGTVAVDYKKRAVSLNISLDNARASSANSGREMASNMVEELQRMVTYSEDPVRKLKERMNSQEELLKKLIEGQEKQEERMRKLLAQKHGRRRHRRRPSDHDSNLGGNQDVDVGADEE